MRFFIKNIILINRVIIALSILVVLATLILTAEFFKEQEKVEKRKMRVLAELRKEEKKRIKIWADAVSQMASISIGESLDPCVLDILKSNNSIPAIWLGANGELKAHRNIDPLAFKLKKDIDFLEKKLLDSIESMRLGKDSLGVIKKNFELRLRLKNDSLKFIQNQIDDRLKIDTILKAEIDSMGYLIPIQIQSAKKNKEGVILLDDLKKPITEKTTDYVYYRDSYVIKEFNNLSNDSKKFAYKLQKLPIIILLLTISIFSVAYLAFYYSKRSQQNKLWAGIAKETAHQIGTPLSSLMGWVEYLKSKNINHEVITEIEKDTNRLQQIADRFSKIGSISILKPIKIVPLLEKTIDYVKKRASQKIDFIFKFEEKNKNLEIDISPELFSWVVENLLKNSIDSLQKKGVIQVVFKNNNDNEYIIDVIDNGKGISFYDFKKIFDPGHTSKKRGWGLGLSLCKRIISEYHKGKIFVLKSNPFQETIFRIIIKK